MAPWRCRSREANSVNSGARRTAALIVCAMVAFVSGTAGDVSLPLAGATAAAQTSDSGLLADVLRVDKGDGNGGRRETHRYTSLTELVNCSSSGVGAFILLRTPNWLPDYTACSPAFRLLKDYAEFLLRRGEGDAALRMAVVGSSTAAAADSRAPNGTASVARKLFEHAPVKEATLTANAASGSGRSVVWRRRGGDAVEMSEAVDWNSTLAAAFFQRRVNHGGAAHGNASSEWSEPLYDCEAREWFAWLIVQQQLPRIAQEESASTATSDADASNGRWQLFILVSLKTCDINQCQGSGLLARTHLCDTSYTTCESASGSGFATGAYTCKCKSCASCRLLMGSEIEAAHADYSRLASESGSRQTTSEYFATACFPEQNTNGSTLSSIASGGGAEGELGGRALLVASGACVVLCWILMIVVMARRDNTAIMSAKWIVLEMVLIGSTLLYGSVMIEYFPAAAWSCLLRPWMRELGFGCTYGALNIKTYKVLAEFRTRKARRVHVRDKDLIKYWLLVLVIMTFYMASWTATTLSLISVGDGSNGGLNMSAFRIALQGSQWPAICVDSAWNVVTELMELTFVATGLYMSYRIRRAPSLFWESKFIAVIFSIECLVSGTYYVARHCVLLSLHQDWAYVASFCRTQATVSLLLLLLLGPKLWYAFHPPGKGSPWSREGAGAELFGYGANINGHRGGGGPGGDSEVVDISLKEMEPEEIWRELRRVYTQLQLLKVKVMRYENPHIHEKKHHRIRKQLYSRISRSGHHHKARPDAAAEEDFACSHEQELLAYEGGQPTAAAAPASCVH